MVSHGRVRILGIADDITQGPVQQLIGVVADPFDPGEFLGLVLRLLAGHQKGRADQHEQHEHAEDDEHENAAALRPPPAAPADNFGFRISD